MTIAPLTPADLSAPVLPEIHSECGHEWSSHLHEDESIPADLLSNARDDRYAERPGCHAIVDTTGTMRCKCKAVPSERGPGSAPGVIEKREPDLFQADFNDPRMRDEWVVDEATLAFERPCPKGEDPSVAACPAGCVHERIRAVVQRLFAMEGACAVCRKSQPSPGDALCGPCRERVEDQKDELREIEEQLATAAENGCRFGGCADCPHDGSQVQRDATIEHLRKALSEIAEIAGAQPPDRHTLNAIRRVATEAC